jgi:hypothetical protein
MRRIATAFAWAAGMAGMAGMAGVAGFAAPVMAQIGTEIRERPAVEARGIRGPGQATRVQNPAAMVLERRADLGLSLEQVQRIEAIQVRVQQENAGRIEQLRAALPARTEHGFREMSAAERQQLRQQMREHMDQLQPVREQIRKTNREAGREIHAVLTEEQREQLRSIRREQMREFRGPRGDRGQGKWLRRGEKPGDAGMRPWGGPRGGGR